LPARRAHKEKPSQGEIVAVGPGGRDEAGTLIPIDLKVGEDE
jgi:chaperonin GroES